MSVQIRLAKPEDAPAIERVASETGVASIDPGSPRARRVLAEGQTLVATKDAAVMGFVGCLFTAYPTGGRRFELDLLAVAPEAQRRGVGTRLVAASKSFAADAGARQVRALVRCENAAMQRLCRRHGFARSSDVFELHIVDPQPVAHQSRLHEARVIPVETLSYSGLWLEGKLSREAIADAHQLASQIEVTVIGAVIPNNALETRKLLQASSFRKVGAYHWWTINLKSD